MKKKINLFWFRHLKGYGNFGDELNPYIISKLSDIEIDYIDVNYLNDNKLLIFKILTHDLLKNKIKLIFFFKYIYINFVSRPELFLAIGSVLQFCNTNKAIVWGSGMLSADSMLPNANYLAVRGYKTIDRINELGFEAPSVVGDPALLLPLLYTGKSEKKYKVGIIPHYVHYEFYANKVHDNWLVINLLDKIEDVIDQINQCELTISTSLHGVITSHAYGVKSLWAINKKKQLSGDNIKFADYFSSVIIKDYEPVNLDNYIDKDEDTVVSEILLHFEKVLLPEESAISRIQNDLLRVFPYKIE